MAALSSLVSLKAKEELHFPVSSWSDVLPTGLFSIIFLSAARNLNMRAPEREIFPRQLPPWHEFVSNLSLEEEE